MAFNSSRHYLRLANAAFAAEVTSDVKVLDAGAGEQPYRDLFAHATSSRRPDQRDAIRRPSPPL